MNFRTSTVRTSLALLIACLAALSLATPRAAANRPPRATEQQLSALRQYIKTSWQTLKRSNERLAQAAVDPKSPPPPGGRWPVYVSRKENVQEIERSLRAQMPAEDFARIEIRQLPESGEIRDHGLLYLPRPYVVPGGRFNEMYGWDSYFTQVGLLRDGELTLAKDMIDNFLYEIQHYGKILNANRTYYLTRSQPPFLTQMILGVYRQTGDKAWLLSTIPAIESTYRFWTSEPHLTPATGLSRYYDFGEGPAPEVVTGERDASGKTHYDHVREYYRTHEVTDYDERLFYDAARDQLTPLFYKGDRSMRESGFDPSNRFGPFNADCIHYDPVCLNSLLYVMETEAAEIFKTLGRGRDASEWLARADKRRREVNRLMWDEKDGLYYDYHVVEKRVRRYPFLTTFYPLWAGIADKRQAARVVANLRMFERPGGLLTSTNVSGSQWDAPYGWAPLQMIAVEGLRRYGYAKEADRVSAAFLSLVLKEFVEHNTVVEKYDVVRRESDLGSGLKFGYKSNEIGFGWTNAAFVELYARMSPRERPRVLSVGK